MRTDNPFCQGISVGASQIMPRLTLAFAVVLSSCLLPLGCSKGGAPPKVTIVTGGVKYQGKAVDGADVTFSPVVESQDSRAATGKTDAQGQFALKCYINPQTELNGAIPGDYKITVVKKEGTAASHDELMKLMQSGKPIPQPKDLLPAKYATTKDSGLRRTVLKGEKNDFQLELTD